MLEEMRIRGLGVIGDALLQLHPGFTVVTGETGAGKTMVVAGLGLLLGARADPGAVRTGEAAALVEGRITVTAGSPPARVAEQAGAELDDGTLLLTRTVTAAGRSRAHAGGRSVPVTVLAQLAGDLVSVHGQSEQLQLLHPGRQRAVLDRFAAHEDLCQQVAHAVASLRAVERELLEVHTQALDRSAEADRLRQGLEDVARVAPAPGEDVQLREEELRLGHADGLRAAAQRAHAAVQSGEDLDAADARTLVAAARRALEPVLAQDPTLADLDARLAEIGYLLADVAADLATYAGNIESDPVRLAAVQERRAALAALTRRYGGDLHEVLAWAREGAARLLELDDDQDRIAHLHRQRDVLREQVAGAAAQLGDSRRAAARRLSERVASELTGLAMPNARLEVQVSRREDPAGLRVPFAEGTRTVAVGPDGADEVELQLAPHAGAPLRPLARSASGGELSRVMLALEVVLAGADPVPTFVFDEVDAGVGGRAALEVGRRLALLARSSQVVVVTHLPQVAAYADRHLLVRKAEDGAVTESDVTALSDQERVDELARMLAGQQESATAKAHAVELLARARAELDALPQAAAPAQGAPGRVAR